jgi:hypothetical protein
MTEQGCIAREELEQLLSKSDGIKIIGWINPDKYGFARDFKFLVKDKEYIIEWWTNLCELKVDGLIIPFTNVYLDDTWPNNSKLNLQFYNGKSSPCAILPVEFYEE